MITRIAHTSANTPGASSANTTSLAIDTTGASLLVVAAAFFGFSDVVTITDSYSNTWSALTLVSGYPSVRFFYCESPIVGATHTFSTVGGATYGTAIAVAAYSGTASGAFDQQSVVYNSGTTTLQAGAVTPSTGNELCIAAVGWLDNEHPLSIDSGFTKLEDREWFTASGAHFGIGLAELIQTTATATNPMWTLSGASTQVSAAIATFKASAVSSTPPTSDFTTSVNQKTVTVTDASTPGTNPITSYDTDWGDSSAHMTTASGSHTYPGGGGTFTITHTVSDGTTPSSVSHSVTTKTRHTLTVRRNPGNVPASVTADVPDTATTDPLIQALTAGQYGDGSMLQWFWGNKPLDIAQDANTMLSVDSVDNTKLASLSFDGMFSGVIHRVPALSIALSGVTLPAATGSGNWLQGIWSVTVDSSNVVTVTGAAGNSTGYTNTRNAIAALPAVPAGSTRIGYVLVGVSNAGPFIPGTTPITDVGGVRSVYTISDTLIGSTILTVPSVGTPTSSTTVNAGTDWSAILMLGVGATEPRWCRFSTAFDTNRVDLRVGPTGSGADLETSSLAWNRSHQIRMNPLTASVMTN